MALIYTHYAIAYVSKVENLTRILIGLKTTQKGTV